MRLLLAATWPCLLLLLLLLVDVPSLAAASSGVTVCRTEWQVLTRANFSSQIRLHPHVLLLVTMPWYGESRSLMTEIEHLVAADEQGFGLLRLMVVYRNSEKMLTDIIGATEGTKFIYYQHSMPFKYQGKLHARAILFSVRHVMSLKHEEAPFEVLRTKEDVEAFVESTDKSVLLSEFCGWFAKLSHSGGNQDYEATLSKNRTKNADISGRTLRRESDRPLELVMEDEELAYGVGGQLSGSPWNGGFTLANESVADQTENTSDGNRILCTVHKFHEFENFFAKLTAIAREYLLPPEKLRFGLITERSSLPSWDVDNLETWFLTIHYQGCTTCSVVAKEGDDLRSLLQSHHYLNMKEIDVDANGGEATFPANRPSVILFIDRLSDFSKVRDESRSSLKLLRDYVQNNYPSYASAGGLSSGNSRMRSTEAPSVMNTGILDAHTDQARLNAWSSKFIGLRDKMAVMVVNDGESVSYRSAGQGSLGSPLYDFLTKLLQKTRPAHKAKKTRISLVGKDVAFQLLSDDSEAEVQVLESLPFREGHHSMTDDPVENSDSVNDDTAQVSVDERKATEAEYIDDGQAPTILEKTSVNYPDVNNNDLEDSSDTEMEEQNKTEVSDMRPDLSQIQAEVSFDEHINNEVGDRLHKDKNTVTKALDMVELDGRNVYFKQEKSGSLDQQDKESSVLGQEGKRIVKIIYEDSLINLDRTSEEGDSKCYPNAIFSSPVSPEEESADYTERVTSSSFDGHFIGSFFFSDGGYQLLRTLTGGTRIPSLVIIDPVQQNHYLFPEEMDFRYSSLVAFFDSFMNQTLASHYRSASSIVSSKELPRPPFVNQNFREANSIPQLTTSSFCQLVLGLEGCDLKNEMSFPITENMASAWKRDVLVLFSNSWCGFCQRTELVVREVYRVFKSFVASSNSQFRNTHNLQIEEKKEESTMDGFPAVYLMDCTSNECYHFLQSAGKDELYPTLLLFPAENKTAIAYEGDMSVLNLFEFLESHVRNSHHLAEHKGYLWKERTVMRHDAPMAVQLHISDKSESSVGSHLSSHSDSHEVHIVRGSILTATEKLGTAVPFDNAKVLVVLADSHEGFQGLIINKRLSWDVFKNLDNTMEPLKQAPLFCGGPVVVQGYHLVSLAKVALEGYTHVIPGVYYGNIIATGRLLERIKSGEGSADDLWFFLGYSGWTYNQLFDELTEGSWHLSAKPIEHLDWPES